MSVIGQLLLNHFRLGIGRFEAFLNTSAKFWAGAALGNVGCLVAAALSAVQGLAAACPVRLLFPGVPQDWKK